MKDVIAERHARERKQRIDKILAAARRLFLQRGYEHTTVRDICRLSRLSNGAVYFYFRSKDDIYARIYEESLLEMIAALDRATHGAGLPLARIEAFLTGYLAFYIEHNDLWNILDISYQRLKLPGELVARFDELMERAFTPLHTAVTAYLQEQGLQDRFDSLEISVLMITSIDGILYNHRQGFLKKVIEPSGLRLQRLVQTQISVFEQVMR